MILALAIVLALLAGLVAGYVLAATRTDHLLARMTDDELKALAGRVRVRKELRGQP